MTELSPPGQDSPSPKASVSKGKTTVKKGYLDRFSADRLQQVAIAIAVVIVAIFMYDLSGNVNNLGPEQSNNTWVLPVIILLGIIFVSVLAFSVYLKRRSKRLKKLKRYGKT